MRALVLMASPRANGRCQAWAHQAAQAYAAQGFEVELVRVGDYAVAGCCGCAACQKAEGHRCVIRDDMDALNSLLDAADELCVVAPVFFAGPPSQLKAVLDRLQPHFWRGTRLLSKRPAALYVVGDGGDPHGYQPLVTIVRSALAVAGFALQTVEARIGAQPDKEN